MYPPKLDKIIHLFETLPEVERRETLVSYADSAKKQEPRAGEQFTDMTMVAGGGWAARAPAGSASSENATASMNP